MRNYFGTDGIRGLANTPPMTVEMALQLGKAIAATFGQNNKAPKVLIGKDPRRSGYMFESALAAGVNAMGGDVLFTGPLPTPAIAYLTTTMRCDAGIMISASHNPYHDNGIKIFGRDGYKLPDTTEAEIERYLDDPSILGAQTQPRHVGRSRRIDDAAGRYIAFLKMLFPRDLSLEGLKIVLDCANGAAYKIAPTVLWELGAEVIATGVEPNGYNINDGVGALYPKHCACMVLEHGADLGMSLDGDADRIIFVDENGQIIDGDQIMALTALELKHSGRLSNNTVVGTVMSNLGLKKALTRAGIDFIATQVGDRYVVEEMRQGGHVFGGEQSGHLIFLQHSTTGDGLIAALEVLAAKQRHRKALSSLVEVMQRFPQVLRSIPVRDKPDLATVAPVAAAIAHAEALLGENGRVLVRYSGTEGKCRVMLEGPDRGMIEDLTEAICAQIVTCIGA